MSEDKANKQKNSKYSLKLDPENNMLVGHDGCHVDNPKEYLWFAVLKGCGCGRSDDFIELAWTVLDYFSQDIMQRQSGFIYDKPENELLAHWLDTKGLIDHGSSIGVSWLTEDGKQLHKVISDNIEVKL